MIDGLDLLECLDFGEIIFLKALKARSSGGYKLCLSLLAVLESLCTGNCPHYEEKAGFT